MVDSKKIDRIKEVIVNAVNPYRVILFGSYANGTATEDSDIDIVVVWDTDLPFRQRVLFLRKLFKGRDFALDIFGYTKKEAEELKSIPGNILSESYNNGKTLYEKK